MIRSQDELHVGIGFPREWDARSDEERADDLDALRSLDPRIRIVEYAYEDPPELRLARASPPYDHLRHTAPVLDEAQVEALGLVDFVLARELPFDVASHAPRLTFVQSMVSGSTQLETAGLAAAGIRLATAAGVASPSIAEFVLGRLLAHWKRFDEIADQQRTGAWERLHGRRLEGSTVAILGLGAIGTQLARRLAALGVSVLAVRRSAAAGHVAPGVDELYGPADLGVVLGRADAVVAALPVTPETIGLMDAKRFAEMKQGAYFVNVGRGSLVDEEALVAALESGQLSGAALDVTLQEPLPPDSPLRSTPGLSISPHCSSSLDGYFHDVFALYRENLRRLLAGDALVNEVQL